MLEQLDSDQTRRQVGWLAWMMAWLGLAVGQLHALSRFATAGGREDLANPLVAGWAVPAGDLMRPLLDWAHPDLVYLHYGKIWFPVFAAITLCAWMVYRRRRPVGFETWAWRVALAGYAVATVGVFVGYWTQWSAAYTEPWFTIGWYLEIPGLLLTLVGSSILGTTLLARRFRPVLPAVLLALAVPLAIGIVQLTSLGNLSLPIGFAFGLLGLRLARPASATPGPPRAVPPGPRAHAQTSQDSRSEL